MNNPLYLELNDKVRFALTGERCKVVEATEHTITLRWPSGDRLEYTTRDPIWHHFKLAEAAH